MKNINANLRNIIKNINSDENVQQKENCKNYGECLHMKAFNRCVLPLANECKDFESK